MSTLRHSVGRGTQDPFSPQLPFGTAQYACAPHSLRPTVQPPVGARSSARSGAEESWPPSAPATSAWAPSERTASPTPSVELKLEPQAATTRKVEQARTSGFESRWVQVRMGLQERQATEGSAASGSIGPRMQARPALWDALGRSARKDTLLFRQTKMRLAHGRRHPGEHRSTKSCQPPLASARGRWTRQGLGQIPSTAPSSSTRRRSGTAPRTCRCSSRCSSACP